MFILVIYFEHIDCFYFNEFNLAAKLIFFGNQKKHRVEDLSVVEPF